MNRLNGRVPDARGGTPDAKSHTAAEAGSAGGFGRRTERLDLALPRVLNTGSSGPAQRTFRSISPPLD